MWKPSHTSYHTKGEEKGPKFKIYWILTFHLLNEDPYHHTLHISSSKSHAGRKYDGINSGIRYLTHLVYVRI